MLLEPTSIEELQKAVRFCLLAIPVGAGTKPALSAVAEDYQRISTLHLSGVVEYDPTEFTITVLAGTPLREIEKALGEHGQYLPFDPPLSAAGATIGGTVAAGLSGPGAFRFGPIRDFLIGVRFIDGEGRLITGGGKVVKNAAGFDLPKFLIGSCGRLGILTELTFKVFPKAEADLTFELAPQNLGYAVGLMAALGGNPFDLDALEFEPAAMLFRGRISGNPHALDDRLVDIIEQLSLRCPLRVCEPAEADYFWKRQLSFDWTEEALIKIPITASRIPTLERWSGIARIYGMGGNVAWIGGSAASATRMAEETGLPFQILRPAPNSGEPRPSLLGFRSGDDIHLAIKQAFDPSGKFPFFSAPKSSSLKSEGPAPIDSRPDPDSPDN